MLKHYADIKKKKKINTAYLFSLKGHRGAAAHRPRGLRKRPRGRFLVPPHDVRTENCRVRSPGSGSTVCSGGLATVCSSPSSTGVWDPRYSFNGMARINPQGENSTTGTIKRTEGRDIFIYVMFLLTRNSRNIDSSDRYSWTLNSCLTVALRSINKKFSGELLFCS